MKRRNFIRKSMVPSILAASPLALTGLVNASGGGGSGSGTTTTWLETTVVVTTAVEYCQNTVNPRGLINKNFQKPDGTIFWLLIDTYHCSRDGISPCEPGNGSRITEKCPGQKLKLVPGGPFYEADVNGQPVLEDAYCVCNDSTQTEFVLV